MISALDLAELRTRRSMRCSRELCCSLLLVLFVACGTARVHEQQNRTLPLKGLVLHYYKVNTTCTYAEEFIKHLVNKTWAADKSVTPALFNLLYSDCFVTGCDGSILLEGEETEMEAPQNAGLRRTAFQLVDRIKRVLEVRCPGVVSCADILNLAARDAAGLSGAPKYPVFTGRRDGFRSTAKLVDLPPPSVSWNDALAYFKSKGLDVLDLGTLLGAHTMGVTHCRYITDRIYNFNGTGKPDDSMDPNLLTKLRQQCPLTPRKGNPDPTVFLNPSSGGNYTFQSSYYDHVLKNRGVLGVDQQFVATMDGIRIANEFANGFEDFRRYFALAMSRMGSLGVLTGKEGEIRKTCRATNSGVILK